MLPSQMRQMLVLANGFLGEGQNLFLFLVICLFFVVVFCFLREGAFPLVQPWCALDHILLM